jgi:hypothetical protein
MSDWATTEADEIVTFLREYTYGHDFSGSWHFDVKHDDAIAWLAAKLRLIENQGQMRGVDAAKALLSAPQ